ncbi:class I SAM-dependent methyltransferase [Hymenobacter chitinivorans]|uniref:Methyltransferase family protein n=1 Tax=Hymenobacter chitinivorans DSM 11115 TaxID=1121954 RepID=A0A2M9BPL4_9BACT|nr:class I SAM-dependent methyltransferase [Hymenobacter chitinivorans]PJJ59873.1 methyltransferase family protein [Hymenobacter chitinivorans DSM 11115]
MNPPAAYLDLNRALWNARTGPHLTSDFYGVEAFKAGKSSLNQIELDLLGDVAGRRILHLQCHFGQDSLSLARLGAQVTGVDLSDAAIAAARQLSAEIGVAAEFICCDIHELPQHLPADVRFDVVFTSYGVLGWLPDLPRWAALVSHYLRPGGRLVLAEFHPVVWMFDNDFTRLQYSYFNTGPIEETEVGTYADREAGIVHQSITWNHSLSEVIGSLLGQGLQLTSFREYDYSPYNCFAHTVAQPDGTFRIGPLGNQAPLVYSVVATRP